MRRLLSHRVRWLHPATLAILLAALLLLLLAGPKPAVAHTVNGRELVNQNSGKCVDVRYASLEAMAPIIQFGCHGGGNEKWDIIDSGDGWHSIRNKLSGLCLDVPYGDGPAGEQLWQWPCNGTDAQKFTVPCDACAGVIKNKATGMCIEIWLADTQDFAAVIQWGCYATPTANQKWLVRSPQIVNAYLYEPVGDSSHQAELNCGWHENCVDGVLTEGETTLATDWSSEGGPNNAWFRINMNTASSVSTYVGRVEIWRNDVTCLSARADVYDRFGFRMGSEYFYHTDTTPVAPSTTYLYANTAGVRTTARAGTYVWPDPFGCPTTGPHTHACWQNGSGYYLAKNPLIPTENSCNGFECLGGRLSDIWTKYTWRFTISR